MKGLSYAMDVSLFDFANSYLLGVLLSVLFGLALTWLSAVPNSVIVSAKLGELMYTLVPISIVLTAGIATFGESYMSLTDSFVPVQEPWTSPNTSVIMKEPWTVEGPDPTEKPWDWGAFYRFESPPWKYPPYPELPAWSIPTIRFPAYTYHDAIIQTVLLLPKPLLFMEPLIIETTAHQWYWNYKLPYFNLEFDSHPLNVTNDAGSFKNMTSSPLCLPASTNIINKITSAGGLHCWQVPVLGVKVDVQEGHVVVVNFKLPVVGDYYGECCEFCGNGHAHMPIHIQATTLQSFIGYVSLVNAFSSV